MEVIIRKSVSPEIESKIPGYIKEIKAWMSERYKGVNFENVDFIFSTGFSRSRYFRNAHNEKYTRPNVCVCVRATIYLYDKKSLGIKKTKAMIGYDAQIKCAMIHELTHHAQYEMDERKGNELDTTRNEMEYLKEYYPAAYNKITK